MTAEKFFQPEEVKQVMISSTFTDLEQHRKLLIDAIHHNDLKAKVMEFDTTKAKFDVLESSLNMVRQSHAYVAVISMKYGQTPEDVQRNPHGLSLTELEFNEATRLKRPILLFIMSENHLLRKADIEVDPEKIKKLNAFREKAKNMEPGSSVKRVYYTFDSAADFGKNALIAIGKLKNDLDEIYRKYPGKEQGEKQEKKPVPDESNSFPSPPEFCAFPPYIGTHTFVGRKEQLEILNEWAAPSDTHGVLLFEAIGGSGKSMLTWEWATKYAKAVRKDWAGIFWYSFYEKGATMTDFCRNALAYMTGEPMKKLEKKKIEELSKRLLDLLKVKPWLLILDGLERVLVSYHRFDAAQIPDDEAGLTDAIIDRDPCSAIRPQDDELLRNFSGLSISRVLISSRLTPVVLLNSSHQPIPGVKRIQLGGLKPSDAEEMIRACGVRGNSLDIQNYMKSNCDFHPLVIGVLAGLINNYLPDRGSFDAWSNDPDIQARLNLADLNLIQRRNHILQIALENLPQKSLQLISTLSLLSRSIDFEMLEAFNPSVPKAPAKMDKPELPSYYENLPKSTQKILEKEYELNKQRHLEYEKEYAEWLAKKDDPDLKQLLIDSIIDLEKRGLLQYDNISKHYDLHPVVRGVVLGKLNETEKKGFSVVVLDYFSRQPHNPYSEVRKSEELDAAINIMRTYLHTGQYQEAFNIYWEFGDALLDNLEEYETVLSLLQPFCNKGLFRKGSVLKDPYSLLVLNHVSIALNRLGRNDEARKADITAIEECFTDKNELTNLPTYLTNLSTFEVSLKRRETYLLKSLEISLLRGLSVHTFLNKLYLFHNLSWRNRWDEAEKYWDEIQLMGTNWPRSQYQQGSAEGLRLHFLHQQGKLDISRIDSVIELCEKNCNRRQLRDSLLLKGEYLIDQKEYALAIDPLQQSIQLAHEVRIKPERSETLMAIAKMALGMLQDPRQEASRLEKREITNWRMAELWILIGDKAMAETHAIAAYKSAWNDGEPYTFKYSLNRSLDLLKRLNAEIPALPAFDPSKLKREDWEVKLDKYIENLKKEKKKEEKEKEKKPKK